MPRVWKVERPTVKQEPVKEPQRRYRGFNEELPAEEQQRSQRRRERYFEDNPGYVRCNCEDRPACGC